MRNVVRMSLTTLLPIGLAAAGCSSAHNDIPYGLMWYRQPPRPPGKSLTCCVAAIGGGLRVDRGAPLSEATDYPYVAPAAGREGRTASIGSIAVRSPSLESPWAPSAAVRSPDSSTSSRLGGDIIPTGSYDERGARIAVGQPGCCSGLPDSPTPR